MTDLTYIVGLFAVLLLVLFAPLVIERRAAAGFVGPGVDASRSRNETKHVVLTNFSSVFFSAASVLSAAGPVTGAVPVVRWSLYGAALVELVPILLNRAGLHTAASVTLLAAANVVAFTSSIVQPDAADASVFFVFYGMLAWFVFPPARWRLSATASFASLSGMVGTWSMVRHAPPPVPLAWDLGVVTIGNRVFLFISVVVASVYVTRGISRAERDLIVLREKNEALLRREISHQVAERSKELGEAFARTDGAGVWDALRPGERFDSRYRIVRTLGTGGMGSVYEVERLTDKQRLALKLVTGPVSAEGAARFAREAEIGARVQHERLVSIIDVGVARSAPYLVMELVDGGSLEDLRGEFGQRAWALPVLRQVAEGLSVLHEAGVVHRDLKPSNVLLTGSGTLRSAKIADFGISRFGVLDTAAVDANALTVAGSVSRRALTNTGAVIGTLRYMAPEGARGGRAVDAPADVFAFGIVAYELVTGRFPFSRLPAVVAMAELPGEAPAPLNEDRVPAQIRDAIVACLATDVTTRPRAKEIFTAFREAGA